MTELQLYKFCEDSEIAWRGDKLILWVPFYRIKEFTEMLGYSNFDEGGLEVHLFSDCLALELNDLCEAHDIEPENILKKEIE